MRALAEAAKAGGSAAQEVLAVSEDVGGRAEALRGEVDGFLASLERAGDRRKYDRHPLDLPCRLTWTSGACETRLHDLSRGGGSIAKALELAPGTEVRIAIGGGPALPARIARAAGDSTGLLFIASGSTEAEVARLLAPYERSEAAAA
jgi:methyl-accepting chemotaxis protein